MFIQSLDRRDMIMNYTLMMEFSSWNKFSGNNFANHLFNTLDSYNKV